MARIARALFLVGALASGAAHAGGILSEPHVVALTTTIATAGTAPAGSSWSVAIPAGQCPSTIISVVPGVEAASGTTAATSVPHAAVLTKSTTSITGLAVIGNGVLGGASALPAPAGLVVDVIVVCR